jgi:hypothetical protein
METKQTTVDWLIEQLRGLAYNPKTHLGMGDVRLTQGYIDWIEEQAKQMEKEQMLDTYIEGRDFAQYIHDEQYGGIEYWDREPMGFEQYYEETYGTRQSNN